MFGKKQPTEFDLKQDATLNDIIKKLNQLSKNQGVLITNNSYFIEQIKKLWSWVNSHESRIKALEAEAEKNRERDEALAARFKNLGSVMVNEEETK